MEGENIKAAVKEQYGKVARGEATCGSLCGCTDNAEGLAITFSNCVLNLVPDKDKAFREIHRVLKPGGRLAVADMAWQTEPSAVVRKDMEALVGCIGGALVLDDYVSRLKQAGFACVEIEKHAEAARKMVDVSGTVPPPGIEHLLSVNITATK
jgi:SAM-dependent methyltransferase